MSYTMYINYRDLYVCKFPVNTTDLNSCYKEMAESMIRDGFKKGANISRQIELFKTVCDNIWKEKWNCHKIRRSDYLLFLTCMLALYKYGKIDSDRFIILKNKNLKKSKKK